MGSPKQVLCLLFVLFLSTQIDGIRPKRMFALCPPHFTRIGNECYFISQNRVNWLDAHFECKDRDSRLAEPLKQEDRFLRKYLNHLNGIKPADLWFGARFNWEKNAWQWGYNGKDLTYQSFSQMSAGNRDLKYHCAILNPNLRYRWSASSCEQQHRYICQHRMPYVNEKNRQKIYNKWNETYPNEMANEIEVVLSQDDILRRRRKMHRSHSKTVNNRQINAEQNTQSRNDIHFNDFRVRDQQRKMRVGNKRLRYHDANQQFDLNRTRASGTRHRIHFNTTGEWNPRQINAMNHRRQKQKKNIKTTTNSPALWPLYNPSTTTRTITTFTSTPTPITTQTPITKTISTSAPPIWLSNDVNNDEEQIQKQNEIEQRHNDEEQRRNREYLENISRIDEERRQAEKSARAAHLRAIEKRQQELIEEEKQKLENERIQERRIKQDAENKNKTK